MGLSAIVLLPLIGGFGMLFWASMLDDDLKIMKLMLQLFFLPMFLLSINFAVIDATILYGADASLINQLGDFVSIIGWIVFLVGAFLLYRICLEIIDWFRERKAKKEAERYD